MKNDLTSAIVFSGLEWMDQFFELIECIEAFREKTDDDIIVYTGYDKEEITEHIMTLKKFKNIVVKYGRFIPNQEKHYDKVLRSFTSFRRSIWRENIMNEKVFKIGSYKLIIKDEDDEKFKYSASLFKDEKLWTKFKSTYEITTDNAFEFFLDQNLMRGRTNQCLNFAEKD